MTLYCFCTEDGGELTLDVLGAHGASSRNSQKHQKTGLIEKTFTFLSREVPVMAENVKGILRELPDRHRHTVQLKVKKKERGCGGRDEPKEEGYEVKRTEAAHLILTVLSKLSQAWKREPQKLPGWKDSL